VLHAFGLDFVDIRVVDAFVGRPKGEDAQEDYHRRNER
jgi:hypothetical protein